MAKGKPQPVVYNGDDSDNTAPGSNGNDLMYGNGGQDTLSGLGGNDTLYGGTGDDHLYGGAGNDLLSGDAGADTLYGEAGNDTVHGGADGDFLYGGDGNDWLAGDGGADQLWGGAGADTFYFATGDSTTSSWDTIRDFNHSQRDKIDLSAITATHALAWYGTTDGSGHEYALWYQNEGMAGLHVFADTDGDGNADLEIQVNAVPSSLQLSDFIGTIQLPNHAPALTGTQAALVSGSEDTAYTVHASDLLAGFTDADGNTLSVSGLTANHGTLTDNLDGTYTFMPDANYHGDIGLAYNVIDGHGGSVAATETFNLAAVNDLPTGAVTISGTVSQNQVLTAETDTIADVDGLGAFAYVWQRSADGSTGWTDIGGATASTYTLAAEDVGQHVRVAVSYVDGDGTSELLESAASVAVNAPPVANDDHWTLSSNATFTAAPTWLTHNDTDVDGNPLYVTSVSGLPSWMTAHSDGSGHLTGIDVAAPASFVPFSFTYEVSDGVVTAVGTAYVSSVATGATGNNITLDGNDFSWIDGQAGNDHLVGAPTLTGNAGIDTLLGGDGGDQLTGGAGADTLTGGGGTDTFFYLAHSDSTLSAPDLITDFTPKLGAAAGTEDKINLHSFGLTDHVIAEQVVPDFLSTDAGGFFAGAGHSVVVQYSMADDSARIYVDVDKDGSFVATNDLVIQLAGIADYSLQSTPDFQW